MSIERVDLNLLVCLDILLRERNVTRAASYLGITQPAMSNSLRRLRELFDDPLLIRTSEGMVPTERANTLQPILRSIIVTAEQAIQPTKQFDPASAERVFRIMASDYAESTLLPKVLARIRDEAPGVVLDILTPSDVNFLDVEQGKVDLVINRFDSMPQSFHQTTVWQDSFTCLMGVDHPLRDHFTLDAYLKAQHIWVSKTGMGVGVGVNPANSERLGWVDAALGKLDKQRRISVFTRHYQAAVLLTEQKDLVLTIPTRLATLHAENPRVVIREAPFEIPSFELKMAWSPLLQHNSAHQWIRQLITRCGREQPQSNA